MLDEITAEFISRAAISLALASRDAHNRPTLFKAHACRVSADRKRITLFLDQQLARELLAMVRDGHPVAAVFSEPATHRTVQIKGERAEVGSALPQDREFTREHCEALIAHIGALDYREEGLRCFFHYSPEQLVSVSFAPAAVFEQTPGPGAGAALSR